MSFASRKLHCAGRFKHAVASFTLLTAVMLACLTTPSSAQTTIFVDNQSGTCSPAGPGTELSPYCTISAAAAAWKGPGITIVVKPGTYREQVTIPAGGIAGSNYVFQAQGPGVFVDGSDNFANIALWTPSLGTTFLAASVTWTPKQVYVDGARLALSTLTPDLMPAGSFSWVTGVGLYVNLGGANPGSRTTLVGHRNYGFNVFTKAFITVDGFNISHTEDRGINMQNGCTDLTISHNSVSFANSYGIHTVNGQRMIIDGNTVSDCNFHGIGLTAGASACIVRNNDSFRNAHPTIRQANGIFLSAAPANLIYGNKLHDNQDTGLQFAAGSNNCVSYNNRSYRNGDHGYDHLGATNVTHVNELAYGNFMDGFSFEGPSPGSQLHNSISVDNGLTTNEFDLWVDAASSVGFVSDNNLFWNSTAQSPVKFISTVYATLAPYQAASGLDASSIQANPLFVGAPAANFQLSFGSPAIDRANSGTPQWPVLDAIGQARMDDPHTANLGTGPVTFGDFGPLEFVPLPADAAPIVIAPSTVSVAKGGTVDFTVTASDPDGDPITSLVMFAVKLPANSGATFVTNATNTSGTFHWSTGSATGNQTVGFIAGNALKDTTYTIIQIKGKVRVGIPADGMEGDSGPVAIAMSSGFPNPSSLGVDFALDLPDPTQVDMSVFDMQGRRVWSHSRAYSAGRIRLHWDGTNASRQRAGVGLYLVRVRAGDSEFVRRIIRL